jgi:hypothetical protein
MKLKRPANWPPTVTAIGHGPTLFCQEKIIVLILLLIIGGPLNSYADCEVILRWDANNPTPEGYQLYGREAGQNFDDDDPWWQGDSTFTECSIDGLNENKIYFFVVRAFAGYEVSGDSNEVRYACTDNHNVSNAGGGSGSGCFIQSLFR